MPADREIALPGAGFRSRGFARRHGLTGFWRWWTRELAALVPAGPRAAVQRRRMRPVIEFDGDVATFWQPVVEGGVLRMAETARFGLAGEAATVAAEGRTALARLLRGRPAGTSSPKVLVALPGRAVLRKKLVLPAAIEDDLKTTLGYDLDRHTPFKADELYFDAVVTGRDNSRGQISVDLAAARRAHVDAAVRHAQSWGATVSAVVPEAPSAATASRLNLLPSEMRNGATAWKRWQLWLPLALLALAALVALVLPVWQKREYAIVQNAVAAQAFQQAAISQSLRAQLDRQVGDFNFALERKYAYPGAVQILEDVTRLLPDDTWLTQLEIKTNGRGKDVQRELLIRGESVNAGRLVTLLEESRLFTQAAPRSPTTKIQPGPGEIFDLGAQMKPLPPPSPVPLAPADKPAVAATAPAAPVTPAAVKTAGPEPAIATAVQSSVPAPPAAATAEESAPPVPGRDALEAAKSRGAPLPQATVPPSESATPRPPPRANAGDAALQVTPRPESPVPATGGRS
jgi:general secretion pathway protein L